MRRVSFCSAFRGEEEYIFCCVKFVWGKGGSECFFVRWRVFGRGVDGGKKKKKNFFCGSCVFVGYFGC